ncbi:hypothetical protein DMB45_08355 [Sanguibacteroides justesenii]|uniref:hypothetical protein n=1 Tax=Porphyromonadaceae TaxID=171551 RepID=UPI00073F877E|nr:MULTISPECIES: hypothetical protein [Porphyromonadaceae]PXZ43973.1 hypothetical protein DMB45_08355 [Sanguibacteroides justesenii]
MKRDKKKYSLPEEERDNRYSKSDDALNAEYNEILESILENNDEDAKDNMSDYMDELREESAALDDFEKQS